MITFNDGWREEQIHQEIMQKLSIEIKMLIFSTLKPKLEIVDDGWNCSYGEWPNYFEGIGSTPERAIADFTKNFFTHKPSKKQMEDASHSVS